MNLKSLAQARFLEKNLPSTYKRRLAETPEIGSLPERKKQRKVLGRNK